jgi:hypothetical protein
MLRIDKEVSSAYFYEIIQELERQPLPVNKYRSQSGEGRSQCFGIVKQRNNTFTGSRMNFQRPYLYFLLLKLAKNILPSNFTYDGIQLNQNYKSKPHLDKGNVDESAIIGFGNYTEGNLVVVDQSVDIKNKLVFFDGSKYLHHTEDFRGNRYSIVFFKINRKFIEVPQFSFGYLTIKNNIKMYLIEEFEDIQRVYDSRGNVLYSSEGKEVVRIANVPTLRPCKELK